MRKNRMIILGLLFSVINIPLWAQKNMETKSISIFKNGSAFFIKSGELTAQNSNVRFTDSLPKALFGTYWFLSPTNDLKSVRSFKDKIKKQADTNTIAEMLKANIGKNIRFSFHGKDQSIDGTVKNVMKSKGNTNWNTSIVAIQSSSGWFTCKVSEITNLMFLEQPNMSYETEIEKTVLQVDFNSSKSKQELDMMYMQNGLGWLPNYLIELTDENKAHLTLRAEVTNDAEDINNTDINFVVGVPNFKFATRTSSLVDFLGNVTNFRSNRRSSSFSNSIAVQRTGYGDFDDWGEDDGSGGGGGWTDSGLQTTSVEDLYFYTLKGVNLKKGGRAYFDVLKKEVNIEHIYEAYINSNQTSRGYYQKTYSFTTDNTKKVYHSIKVSNDSKFPWTTGSAMVMKNEKGARKPISQDLLQYTPVNGSSFVKLTEAPDVKIKHAEKEIERETKKVKWRDGYYYDLVKVEGQVKIKNHKSKDINLNVKRVITGAVDKSDEKWLKTERVNLSGSINKTTDICWEMKMKAGEEKIIKYSYEVYVRY